MGALSYVVAIRADAPDAALVSYLLDEVASLGLEVVVVDGSEPEVFAAHASLCATGPIRHLPVDPSARTPMGKVGGVMTGVVAASHDKVVIADDDVRYSPSELAELSGLLDRADVVRPQNYFDPLPWHARWDTARILLARTTGGDWPGTMGVRRHLLLAAGGYAGDVLFENLELERTIVAAGGRSVVALDLLVRRTPPPTRQFLDQRVRQAYDELARPVRMAVSLALAPLVARTGWRGAAVVAGAAVGLAELGRRRGTGRALEVFSARAALWAPLWVAERALTSWLALGRLIGDGGIRYRGATLRRAATPRRELRARLDGLGGVRSAEPEAPGARRPLVPS